MLGNSFEIAGWTVDVRALLVSRGETTHKLEPKVMELLVCLASRPGEVLTRQELEETLWGRVVVGYDSLTRAVTKLRRAFDDDVHHPSIIETVPKVGYRLIAAVEPSPASSGPHATARRPVTGQDEAADAGGRIRRRSVVALAAIALLLAIGGLVSWAPWAPDLAPATADDMAFPLPDRPSIAVLPLANLSQDPSQERLADAFTDLLITELSRFPELFVISHSSTLVYKERFATVQQIAQELGVRYLVEGGVQRSGDRLRVTVQLIDAIKGNHVWAERYERDVEDLFTIQNAIVRTMVATVYSRVVDSEVRRIQALPPRFLEAYELTEHAKDLYNQWTEESVREAQRLAEKSLELDPNYLRTYTTLAAIYREGHRMGWLEMPRDRAADRMREIAERAMGIDSNDYHSHWAMAIYHREMGDQQASLEHMEKALDLNPNNPLLLWHSAETLALMGRFEESLARFREAMRLNPHHEDWWYWFPAWAQYAAGHCEDALQTIRQMKPLPNMARRELAAIHVCLGQIDEARAVMAEFLEHEPDHTLDDYRRLFDKAPMIDDVRDRNLEDLRKAGLPEAGAEDG